MTERVHIRVHEKKANPYASREDFRRIFSEDLDGLYQLSFLLTRDSERAERCFVAGLEDCVTGTLVFREWARSWAKRTIIQNAIGELNPRPDGPIRRLQPSLTSTNFRVVQASISRSMPCFGLKTTSDLCS